MKITTILAPLLIAPFLVAGPSSAGEPFVVTYYGSTAGGCFGAFTGVETTTPFAPGYQFVVDLQGACYGFGASSDFCFLAGTVSGGLTSDYAAGGNGCGTDTLGAGNHLTITGTGIILGTPSVTPLGPVTVSYGPPGAELVFTASLLQVS